LIRVDGVPSWVDHERLLGPGSWSADGSAWVAELSPSDAQAVQARLRGVGLGGRALTVAVVPAPKRASVRAARLADARARRDTTPGFTRPGAQLDDEGRLSLTPEALALGLGLRARGRRVLDAGCGCGGNSIGFARAGCRVLAVDTSEERLALARHNARLYGVADRISFVYADAREVVAAETPEVLFVDPPWGGPGWDRTRTTAADLPLVEALWSVPAAEVWAKVPPSFAPASLEGAVPEAWFGEASGDRHRVKFVLVRRPSTTVTPP
jgi:trimethylguanosine synthase